MKTEEAGLRDLRTTGFFWISHTLLAYKLSWRALLTYMAIAAATNSSTQKCRKAIPQLADHVGISPDTFKRGMKELVDKGAIKIKPRSKKNHATGNQEQTANEYILIDLKPVAAAPAQPRA